MTIFKNKTREIQVFWEDNLLKKKKTGFNIRNIFVKLENNIKFKIQ